jgi:hypothetical protein
MPHQLGITLHRVAGSNSGDKPGEQCRGGDIILSVDTLNGAMADSSDTEEEEEAQSATDAVDASSEEVLDEEVVIDLESAEEYEEQISSLEEQLEAQREEIDELQDLLLDLSVRVADGQNMGVCPECHGPVVKKTRWLRANTIECTKCDEQFHEY